MTRSKIDDQIRDWCEARGLRFRPWEIAPWDVDAGPAPYTGEAAGAISWPKAQRLRARIIADLGQVSGKPALP